MLNLHIERPTQKTNLKEALNRIQGLGDFVSLRRYFETIHYREARNGRPETNTVTFDEGVMVEVLKNGQLAYAGTSDLSLSGIEKAARKALEMAEASEKHKLFQFSKDLRPRAEGAYKSPRRKGLETRAIDDFYNMLCESTKHMQVSDKIVTAVAEAHLIETEVEYLTTAGTHTTQNFLLITSNYSATAQAGSESQTRSLWGPRGLTQQIGLEVFEDFGKAEDLKRTGEEAVELLNAPNCPTGAMDLLLMPNQMYIQIHESIGHPLEMDRILGDERNYAGWSFIQPSDFGELQYGSKLMNITFDPTHSGEFASYAFDDGGNPAKKEYLIQDGKLLRGLGSLESQQRMKKPGVANFRSASWNRAPIDRMANINVEAGTTTLPDMIKQVENGVLMEANISWSIDDYRNKFQFGCEIGRVIKNGKITHIVKNPNYRGNTLQFWRSLKAVGTAQEVGVFGSPYCGKGEPSQIIRVGHNSPPCLFSNIEVFGGGQ